MNINQSIFNVPSNHFLEIFNSLMTLIWAYLIWHPILFWRSLKSHHILNMIPLVSHLTLCWISLMSYHILIILSHHILIMISLMSHHILIMISLMSHHILIMASLMSLHNLIMISLMSRHTLIMISLMSHHNPIMISLMSQNILVMIVSGTYLGSQAPVVLPGHGAGHPPQPHRRCLQNNNVKRSYFRRKSHDEHGGNEFRSLDSGGRGVGGNRKYRQIHVHLHMAAIFFMIIFKGHRGICPFTL